MDVFNKTKTTQVTDNQNINIMKTKILSIIALFITVTVVSNAASAEIKNNDSGTIVAEAANFNKIEVRGNVELYLTDGDANSVKVYNNYYGENALVQNHNGILRISSYTKDKLVVYVTVADLRAISAYDNAVVKSFKNLSAIELDVNLYNNSSAQLDIQAYQANIHVNDRAAANLLGNIDNCDLTFAQSSTVNSANLVAGHFTKTIVKPAGVKKEQELAIL